jgi:small subunit ribosomal protein S2
VDFPIPANDDATKSIELVLDTMLAALNEGLEERKSDKERGEAVPEEGEEAETAEEGVEEAGAATEPK